MQDFRAHRMHDFSRFQAVHPRPIDEEEEAKKNDDIGDEYFCLKVTPFRGYEERDGKKEEVARLVVFFTPFFLYMMELILRNFNMTGIVEAILDVLEGYDEFRI